MNIQEIIKKLNSIDAKDLKEIDFEQIQMGFRRRPDILVSVIILLVTIVGTVSIYNRYKKTQNSITQESIVMGERLDAIKTKDAVQKQYDQLIESFPENISLEEFIQKLSATALGMANRYDQRCRITSISPAIEKEDDYVSLSSVTINVQAETFQELVLFTDTVENFPYKVRTERWSYNSSSGAGAVVSNLSKSQSLQVTIKFIVYQLKL